MADYVQELQAQAAWYRRQMTIAGPNDRHELERLAMREERLAAQLACEAKLFSPAPAVMPGQAGLFA